MLHNYWFLIYKFNLEENINLELNCNIIIYNKKTKNTMNFGVFCNCLNIKEKKYKAKNIVFLLFSRKTCVKTNN